MKAAAFDIAVIGAGASGLMAAVSAASAGSGTRVIVLETGKEPALKLYATGNGRCNYLNRNASASSYYCNEAPDTLPKAASVQIPKGCADGLVRVFRGLGIEPYEEAEGRLYPRSLQASSVVRALVSGAERLGPKILCSFEVSAVEELGKTFVISSRDGRKVQASSVILACGGKAGIQYGCTGDGYRIASSLGHRIVKPITALTKLICAEDMKSISGVRAKGRISLINCCSGASSIVCEDRGEIQFTDDGLSGICTFNVSRFYRIFDGASYRAELDLLEEFSDARLREMILERRAKFSAEPADMLLMGLLPSKLSAYLLGRCGASAGSTCGDLSTARAEELARMCKELNFTVTGTRSWKDAQVTAGGVSLREVDPLTLESKIVPGLYFAGEVLDIDGPCGGYNLTWAFASGRSAGRAAAERSAR